MISAPLYAGDAKPDCRVQIGCAAGASCICETMDKQPERRALAEIGEDLIRYEARNLKRSFAKRAPLCAVRG